MQDKSKVFFGFCSLLKNWWLWDRRAHGPDCKVAITELPRL